jgi:hypothetical protein
VIPVHLLNKLSDPPDFGYKTEICMLEAESNFSFLKSDREDGRYTTLWKSTWEVVSSVELHTTLRNALDPIHTDETAHPWSLRHHPLHRKSHSPSYRWRPGSPSSLQLVPTQQDLLPE